MSPREARAERPPRPPRCATCGRCSRCRQWTEPEDAFVDMLVGACEPAEIARRLCLRFGVTRTATAVVERLKRRGRSRWMEGLSLRDLERIFGVDHRTILRWWVGPGLLVGQRWSGRGPPPAVALRPSRRAGVCPGSCLRTRRAQDAVPSPAYAIGSPGDTRPGLAVVRRGCCVPGCLQRGRPTGNPARAHPALSPGRCWTIRRDLCARTRRSARPGHYAGQWWHIGALTSGGT